jgi:hypothetical protein
MEEAAANGGEGTADVCPYHSPSAVVAFEKVIRIGFRYGDVICFVIQTGDSIEDEEGLSSFHFFTTPRILHVTPSVKLFRCRLVDSQLKPPRSDNARSKKWRH